jgi:D-alanine-D-alanine ligase
MSQPAVIFGGPSLEHDVSILTGLQASRVLARINSDPIVLYWTEANRWYRVPSGLEASAFLEGVPPGARPVTLELGGREPGFYEARPIGRRRSRIEISAAVVCCHGGPGEDGRLQGLLDLAGVPYTGPGAACAALTMDKLAFGALMASAKLPALPRIAWSPSSPEPDFPGPYIVKPRFGGSSIGIEIVGDAQTARDLAKSAPLLQRGAVLEPYKANLKDLYIAIRSYPKLQLSLTESPRPGSSTSEYGGKQIYGYREKYLEQQGAESKASEIPAQLSDVVAESIHMAAEKIAFLTGLTGAARLDFLSDGSQLWVNELNSIPGAMAFRLWAESGVSHEQLLADMIDEALAQAKSRRAFDPPDRHARERKAQTLQIASKIAQKLTGG